MKKILLIVPSLNVGGMERMLVNVANVLINSGNDVTVLNLTEDDRKMSDLLSKDVKYIKNAIPIKFIFHAHISDILHGKVRFLPFKYWMKIHSAEYIHRKIIGNDYDTEVAFYTGYCVKIISGCSKNTKKIFWLHTEARDTSGFTQGFWNVKQAIRVYKGYDTIVCVSKKVESDFQNLYGSDCNTVTIPNFNDIKSIKKLSEERFSYDKKGLTFALVGRIDNQPKGFDRVLDAAVKLKNKGYVFTIWVVGDGVDLDKLRDKKNILGLDNVFFFGMQENPYKFVKVADVFVCSSNYEAYGLVVSEALILEKPVISTNVSGPAEILDHGKYGMIVENSTDGIYNGMKAFLDDEKLLSEYTEKAKKRSEFFDENKIGKMIQDVV